MEAEAEVSVARAVRVCGCDAPAHLPPLSQVIRQQATIAALNADVHAWEDTLAKHSQQHAVVVAKLQVWLSRTRAAGSRPTLPV